MFWVDLNLDFCHRKQMRNSYDTITQNSHYVIEMNVLGYIGIKQRDTNQASRHQVHKRATAPMNDKAHTVKLPI